MRQANFRESRSLISKYRHFSCFVNKIDLCGKRICSRTLNKTVSISLKKAIYFFLLVQKNNRQALVAAQILKKRQVHMSSGRNLYFSSNPKDNSRNCVWPQLKQNGLVCKVFFLFDPDLFIKYVFLSQFGSFKFIEKDQNPIKILAFWSKTLLMSKNVLKCSGMSLVTYNVEKCHKIYIQKRTKICKILYFKSQNF